MNVQAVEDELEKLGRVILAAEKWHKDYRKDPVSHGKLINAETRLERLLRKYFREFAEQRLPYMINWIAYNTEIQRVQAADDFKIDVLIEDGPFGNEDALLIQTLYDPVEAAVALGVASGEKVYSLDVGISRTSAVVRQTAREIVAELVGKRLNKDGQIIDNPNAKFRISDKTRKDIRESLSTSIALGEDQTAATERLTRTVKDPRRAGTIARTEAVNSYQRGLLAMGQESGAVGKQWQSVNPDDICGVNAAQGIIKLDERFASGHLSPSAHPNCRCTMRLVYPEEFNGML